MATVYTTPNMRPEQVALVHSAMRRRGIGVAAVDTPPADLGHDTGKYAALYSRPVAYTMGRLAAAMPDMPVLSEKPLLDTNLGDETPFVLKRPNRDSRGVNKYLIETPRQRQRLERLRNDYPNVADHWYGQEYVEGPLPGVRSSFRTVVTASGVLVASALIYRETPRDEKIAVTFQREPGFPVHYTNRDGWVDYFNRPESPYYLDSAVIASNVHPGGRVIPLRVNGEFGADVSRITHRDYAVAEAHGLTRLETPADITEWTPFIGTIAGPEICLNIGNDFLANHDNTRRPLVEVNLDPAQEATRVWNDLESASALQVYAFELDRFADGVRPPA